MAAPRAFAEVVNALVQRGVPEPVAIRMASDEGFRLYHGSPYDFEQFESQRYAGTGMGAQVFGQGAYLAEREGVAEIYARRKVANSLLATGGEGLAPQFFFSEHA